MKTNYLKYVTIPIVIVILYAVMQLLLNFLYIRYNGQNYHVPSISAIISYSILRPYTYIIFILPLIFAIAYNLTQLSVRTIVYSILIALALFIMSIIDTPLMVYATKYLNHIFEPTETNASLFILLGLWCRVICETLIFLITTGITYWYTKYYTLPIMPLNKKYICLLYASFFLFTPFIFEIINSMPVLIFFFYSDPFFLTFTGKLYLLYQYIPLLISFIYFYFWTNKLLPNSKNLTNYPYKMIFSSILATLFIIIACTVIVFIYRFSVLLSFVQNSFIPFMEIGLILAYAIGFSLFFILREISNAPIYRYTHGILYILIVFMAINAQSTPTVKQTLLLCGLSLFTISLTLYILYLSNKIAINLCFKNTNTQNINEI